MINVYSSLKIIRLICFGEWVADEQLTTTYILAGDQAKPFSHSATSSHVIGICHLII